MITRKDIIETPRKNGFSVLFRLHTYSDICMHTRAEPYMYAWYGSHFYVCVRWITLIYMHTMGRTYMFS